MNRAIEIKRIIEGFKLGDLGAGKAKLVDLPEPEPLLESPKWMKADPSFTNFVAGVGWKEANGYSFVIACIKKKQKYEFRLIGGEDYHIPSKLTAEHTDRLFTISILKFGESDDKKAEDRLKAVFHNIQKEGSFGRALTLGRISSGRQNWVSESGNAMLKYLRAIGEVPK